MPAQKWLLTLLLLLPCAGYPQSAELPTEPLPDQFGSSLAMTETTELVLYAAGMDASKLVDEALRNAGSACSGDSRLLYIADISGMPSLIAKWFAIPKMKDYPYRVALDRGGNATAGIPRQPDQVTLLHLNQGDTLDIHFTNQLVTLDNALRQLCGNPGREQASEASDAQ